MVVARGVRWVAQDGQRWDAGGRNGNWGVFRLVVKNVVMFWPELAFRVTSWALEASIIFDKSAAALDLLMIMMVWQTGSVTVQSTAVVIAWLMMVLFQSLSLLKFVKLVKSAENEFILALIACYVSFWIRIDTHTALAFLSICFILSQLATCLMPWEIIQNVVLIVFSLGSQQIISLIWRIKHTFSIWSATFLLVYVELLKFIHF